MQKFDWTNECQLSDANEAYNLFLDQFKNLYSAHFPLKSRRRSRKIRKPWITQELKHEMKIRDQLYQRFLSTRAQVDLVTFKQHRNKLTKKLRFARKEYLLSYLNVDRDRHDLLWSRLNTLLHRRKIHAAPSELQVNGQELSGNDLADAFNTFFCRTATSSGSSDALEYMSTPNSDSIFMQPATDQEIISVIQNLKNSTSRDIDDLQVRPVKHVADIIAPGLANIFNTCLTTAVFPAKMQIGKVTVIYKKGDRNDLSNYRPVSILPVFSKVFEKLLHIRLSKFIDKYNLLTSHQYGFTKNKSTELALLAQKEFILEQFEQNFLALGVFVDFSKAFDLVDYNILLLKLERYGIRGTALQLIRSYLSQRKQVVQLNNARSAIKFIHAGVPQGSILGPLLFNLYLNDIININPEVTFIMYADDASIFFSGKNISEIISACNDTMIALGKWATNNSMRINEQKTKAIFFRPINKIIPPHHAIVLNFRNVEIVESFKCLGVIFSSHMSWNDHINYLITKLAQITGLVGSLKYQLSTRTKLLLYNSLFYSHLNYCQLVWGTAAPSILQRIHLLQKKYIRHVYNTSHRSHTADLFHNAKVISIYNLYKYRLSVKIKTELRHNLNSLQGLANLQTNLPRYPTRYAERWLVPTPRLNTGKQRLSYTLPSLLNTYKLDGFDLFSCPYRNLRLMYSS